MKYLKYLFVGIVFGIVLTKSEAVSWYRIFEMFRFESFHMYGIIGTGVFTGVTLLQLAKRWGIKTQSGNEIMPPKKLPRYTAGLIGGTFFGLGWALAGACPGPMFILFGAGFYSILIVLVAALAGTFIYGVFADKLPH